MVYPFLKRFKQPNYRKVDNHSLVGTSTHNDGFFLVTESFFRVIFSGDSSSGVTTFFMQKRQGFNPGERSVLNRAFLQSQFSLSSRRTFSSLQIHKNLYLFEEDYLSVQPQETKKSLLYSWARGDTEWDY